MTALPKHVKPAHAELLRLAVVRREQLTPHWMRITLGGGDIARFTPMGYDQWFRLLLPVGGAAGLDQVPEKANTRLGYLKFLRIPESERPAMRNYTVRAYRPATADNDAEIDIDFVLHGSAADGTAGPASEWAETCAAGDNVLLIDEGLGFNPARGTERVILVCDETGLPAVAGVCASLPADAAGTVIAEVPSNEDVVPFDHPAGISVQWIGRDPGDVTGRRALAALRTAELPQEPLHAFIVGEQALASGARKHLAGERGVSKDSITFTGYWRIAPAEASAARVSAGERAG